MAARDLFVGLMSGTSLDGVDAALVEFAPPRPVLVNTAYFSRRLNVLANALLERARCRINRIHL